MFGFKGNQALLSADRATKQITSTSPLALLGAELISDSKDTLHTATQLAKYSGLATTGENMNLILEKNGLHRKLPPGSAEAWELTEKGKPFAERLDVNKAHGKGVPVKQTKWHTS